MRRHLGGLVVCICAVAVTAACSKDSSCASPTSPSCSDSGSSGTTSGGGTSGTTGGGTSSTKPLTQTQISQVSAAVSPAVSLAFSKMSTALASTSFAIKANASEGRVRTEASSFPFNGTAACDSGGSISVNGSFTDGTNSRGSGPVTMSMTVGFSNCVETGVRLQGNPNLTFNGTFNFSNFAIVNPASFSMGGGFLFTLNGVTGSAAYNCTDNINVNTFDFVETGNVTLQYPTGQNSTSLSCSAF